LVVADPCPSEVEQISEATSWVVGRLGQLSCLVRSGSAWWASRAASEEQTEVVRPELVPYRGWEAAGGQRKEVASEAPAGWVGASQLAVEQLAVERVRKALSLATGALEVAATPRLG